MAFDELLADRVRDVIAIRASVSEKRMFGALAFFVAGNMACGVRGDELFVRLPPEEAEQALAEPGVRPFEMGRGQARGLVLVAPDAIAGERELAGWIDQGAQFAASLPPKSS